MFTEEKFLRLINRKDVGHAHWTTDRNWWKRGKSDTPDTKETFDIWMKAVDSMEVLNQRVSGISMATGLTFKKTHMGNDIILKYESEEFNVRIWVPLKKFDDLTEILSGFYNCEIVRTVHTSPEQQMISYSCRDKKE